MWYTILITLVVDFGGLLLMYMLLRDRVRRATSAESRISEIRDEVSRLLVELNQATDRNIALMEDKITVLNEAISTADKKIGLLRRETEKHDVGSQIYSRLAEGRHKRAAESAGYRDADSALPLAVELSEQNPRGTVAVNPRGAEVQNPPGTSMQNPPGTSMQNPPGTSMQNPPGTSVQNPPGTSAPDVRQRVMMLYRAGFSPSLIASRVGAPLGEVELIISLEQRKGQA